jgi:hypothetical protein
MAPSRSDACGILAYGLRKLNVALAYLLSLSYVLNRNK